jgi:hypothetical protein
MGTAIGPRLRAELEMRRHAVDGKEHPPTAFIFGDEAGGEVKSIRRAWETAVLKAHGHTPDWIAKGEVVAGVQGDSPPHRSAFP